MMSGLKSTWDPDIENLYAMMHVLSRSVCEGIPRWLRQELVKFQVVRRCGPLLFLHTPPARPILNKLLGAPIT